MESDNLTYKQEIFRDYLLKRLGFEENDFRIEYTWRLSEIVFIHKGIAAIERKDWNANSPNKYYHWDDELELYLPEKFTIIDFLLWEYKLKKNRKFKLQNNHSKYISASDLANYTYCPVGYSIGKTYQCPLNQLGDIGIKKHDEHRLVNSFESKIDPKGTTIYASPNVEDKFCTFINTDTKDFFNDIKASDLIFCGHKHDNEVQYFINEEKNFIGQPDYIFRNKKGHNFVVEEKFKRNKDTNQNYFFRNHKIQLASYIYYINQYKIDYGYLVYWLYDYYNGNFDVQDCKVLKIFRSKNAEDFLSNGYNSILDFNKNKFHNLNLKELNPKKCANCVFIVICGHKNQKRNQVTLPYQASYLSLYYAEYPWELKKDEEDKEN